MCKSNYIDISCLVVLISENHTIVSMSR